MKNLKELAARMAARGKTLAGVVVTGSALMAGSAFAQTTSSGGSIDTSAIVSTIGEGLAAVAAIGAAWLGFKYLKKVWARL